MSTIADQYFFQIHELGLIVCKECKYAVWPADIDSHLYGLNHQVKKQERKEVVDAVQEWIPGWQELVIDPSELDVPQVINTAIPELPVWEGLVCKKGNCAKVYRGEKSIKKHWREEHQWAVSGKTKGSGRLSVKEKEEARKQFEEACEKVLCQRFFPSRHGSQYFRIEPQQQAEDQQTQNQPNNPRGSIPEIRKQCQEKLKQLQEVARTQQ